MVCYVAVLVVRMQTQGLWVTTHGVPVVLQLTTGILELQTGLSCFLGVLIVHVHALVHRLVGNHLV